MKTIRRMFQLNLTSKEVEKSKKIMALFMIPMFIVQMSSLNLFFAQAAIAQDLGTTTVDSAPQPKTDPPMAEATKAEEPKTETPAATTSVPDPTPTPKTTPDPVPAPSPEPAPVVTPEPVPAITEPAVTENTEPVLPPAQDIIPLPVEEAPNTIAETLPAPEKEIWSINDKKATTNYPVETGKEYQYPGNKEVIVKFTKLPEKPGTLSIEEIKLSDKEVASLGAFSNAAYDITSSMEDETFAYDLTLPKPKDEENIEIKYAEDADKLKDAKTISDDDVDVKNDSVKISDLDHFTVFVVVWNFDDQNLTSDSGSSANNLARNVNVVGASGINFYSGASGAPTDKAVSAINWNGGSGTKYWQIEADTTGYSNLTLSSRQQSSGTGPRDFKIQYSLNSSDWTDVPGGSIIVTGDFDTGGRITNLELPAACDNQAIVYLRWLMNSDTATNGSSVGSGGTNRIDNIVVQGNEIETGSLKVNKQVDDDSDGTFEGSNTEAANLGITYRLDAGSDNAMGSTINNIPISSGSVSHSVSETQKTGYTFNGWYTTGSATYSCATPEGFSLPISVNILKDTTTEITLCNSKLSTPPVEICNDAVDNDGDQNVDCADSDCASDPVCNQACYTSDGSGVCTLEQGADCTCLSTALDDNVQCQNEVRMTSDILDAASTCVGNITNFNNKTLDCQNFTIDGDYAYPHYGFELDGRSGDTIKNCRITDFYSGIYMENSNNMVISHNIMTHNVLAGIQITNGAGNSILHNNLDQTSTGLQLSGAQNTTVDSNTMNNNPYWGVEISGGDGLTFTNNEASNNGQYGLRGNVPNTVAHNNRFCGNNPSQTADRYDLWIGDNVWPDHNTCDTVGTWVEGGVINLQCLHRCADVPLPDIDGDGYDSSVDCNDNDAAIHPGATETYNNIDDDCDGQIDEGCEVVVCGNNVLESGEQCDDGNTASNDGCSATCQTEQLITFNKQIRSGGANPDNWSFSVEGYGPVIPNNGSAYFAPGTYAVTEDGGILNNSNHIIVEVAGACQLNPAGSNNIELTVPNNSSICQVSNSKSLCGDGAQDFNEQCDDGNTTSGDGCSATCQTEILPVCGDGQVNQTSEQCDDGNIVSGDGCSETCQTEKEGSISGKKFEDCNADGIFQNCEYGMRGWTIFIDADGDSQLDPGETSTSTGKNGKYTFGNLPAGTYRICESPKTGWIQTLPGDAECYDIVLNGEDLTGYNFGNFKLATVQGRKYNDLNGNGWKNFSEPYLNNWTIRLYDSAWVKTGEQTTSGSGWDKGTYSFNNLQYGTYYVCEVMPAGWQQTAPKNNLWGAIVDNGSGAGDEGAKCYKINVNCSGQIFSGKTFGNEYNPQEGKISGAKFEDINGNKNKDEGELNLAGWTIYLDLNNNSQFDSDEPETITDANGYYEFTGLAFGSYYVREVNQTGWIQTTPYHNAGAFYIVLSKICPEAINQYFGNQRQSLPFCGDGILDPASEQCDDGNNVSGDGCSATCQIEQSGNSKLTIEKFNDKWPVIQKVGNVVVYTIIVTALENKVNGVIMTDLPPEGFKYIPGSWTAESSLGAGHIGQLTLTHEYASPGTWGLGDMQPGEEVTLTYKAQINSNQQPGTYNDLAWADGSDDNQTRILASSVVADTRPGNDPDDGVVTGTFVGTQIALATTGISQDVSLNERTKTDTDTKRKVRRVLGASIVLPATGSNTGWAVLALAILFGGIGLMIAGRKKKNFSFKIIMFAILGGGMLFLGLINLAKAASVPPSIRLEKPATPNNISNLIIGFVALDVDKSSMTVNCYKQGPGDASFSVFDTVSVQAGGNSGTCDFTLPTGGTYLFKADVTSANGSSTSDIQTVVLNSDIPGTPFNYDRPSENCTVTFTTANDGLTAKVELYRSTSLDFMADSSTFVTVVSILPNTNGTITDPNADCGGSFYYAIRAVSEAGVGSNFVGDEKVTVNHRTRTRTVTHTTNPVVQASGAIPVADEGGTVAGGNESGVAPEGAVQGETAGEGQILGEKTEEELATEAAKKENSIWKSAGVLAGLGLLAYIFYAIAKRRKSKQPKLPNMDQ